jgi:RNA recognition motif-containing protein
MHGSKLYIGNLPYSTTSEDLERLFSQYGIVKHAKVIQNKGIAFIDMATQAEAEKAKGALDGHELKGFKLTVQAAKPPKQRSFGFRR